MEDSGSTEPGVREHGCTAPINCIFVFTSANQLTISKLPKGLALVQRPSKAAITVTLSCLAWGSTLNTSIDVVRKTHVYQSE